MADNIIIDRASAAASLPAPTAPLPLFPSDAKFIDIERAEYNELRLILIQLVEQERAHLDPTKYANILNVLWGTGVNSLIHRFAQWEPDWRKKQIRE